MAYLNMAARKRLSSSQFARPGMGQGPSGKGSGAYPIPDRAHAVAALRFSAGKPEAGQVRAAVRKKFGIG